MTDREPHPTAMAALALGVSEKTMRSWRRRNVGPSYARYLGGCVHSDRYWPEKALGSVRYSYGALEAFAEWLMVPRGRLPRPCSGRLPGGNRHPPHGARPDAASPERGFAGTATPLWPAILAAWLIGVTPTVLRAWRVRGIGPAYAWLPSGRIRYPLDDVLCFRAELDAQRRRMPRGKGKPTQVQRPGGTRAP